MASRELNKVSREHRAILNQFREIKPVPLGAMAKALGLNVKLSAMKPGVSGSISNLDGQYLIKINKFETRERQRFTLAHEISHFLLHRNIIDQVGSIQDNVLYRSGQSAQIEFEANRLAADLVLPDNMLERDISSLNAMDSDETIGKLAREWQVSKAAMEIKLSFVAA